MGHVFAVPFNAADVGLRCTDRFSQRQSSLCRDPQPFGVKVEVVPWRGDGHPQWRAERLVRWRKENRSRHDLERVVLFGCYSSGRRAPPWTGQVRLNRTDDPDGWASVGCLSLSITTPPYHSPTVRRNSDWWRVKHTVSLLSRTQPSPVLTLCWPWTLQVYVNDHTRQLRFKPRARSSDMRQRWTSWKISINCS
jgi:hypothetical protein